MSDPVTQAQFFERMLQLENKMQEYHRSGRDHVDEQVDRLLSVFSEHEKEDRGVAARLLVVETERGIEKAAASKHGALAGSIAAGLVLGLVEAVKRLVGPQAHP